MRSTRRWARHRTSWRPAAIRVVLVEGEAEHADAVGVGVDARQRLGVVAVDVGGHAVGADLEAGLFGVVFVHAHFHHGGHGAGVLTADEDHVFLEDFAGAVRVPGM
jgi:hypothetical protein